MISPRPEPSLFGQHLCVFFVVLVCVAQALLYHWTSMICTLLACIVSMNFLRFTPWWDEDGFSEAVKRQTRGHDDPPRQ